MLLFSNIYTGGALNASSAPGDGSALEKSNPESFEVRR
jgi:hypothetical protein